MATPTPPSQPAWVIQPYGFITKGASTSFSWTNSTAGTVNDSITYTLEYSTNGGLNFYQIASGLTINQYTWVLPDSISTGTIIFLRVTAVESNGQTSISPLTGAITVVTLQEPAPVDTSVVPSTIMKYSNDPLASWRSGSANDPYVQKNESLPVINGRIVLAEVPDPLTKVTITNYFEIITPNVAFTLDSTQYVVDYNTGIVFFNSSENGKTVSATYKGRGKIMFPANRVYLNSNNPSYYNNFPQTIQDIVDNHQTAIQTESNIVYYLKSYASIGDTTQLTTTAKDTLVNAINEVKNEANTNQTNIATNTSDINTIKTEIGTFANLGTTTKTDLVSAINEIKNEANTNQTNIATNTNSINTINGEIGTVANLTTTIKTDLVSAINSLQTSVNTNSTNISNNTTHIGNIANLTTSKGDLVSAINEVRTELHKITDGNGNVVGGTIIVNNIASLPTASSSNRNQLVVVQGDGTTTADKLYMSMISATGTYSWVQVISG